MYLLRMNAPNSASQSTGILGRKRQARLPSIRSPLCGIVENPPGRAIHRPIATLLAGCFTLLAWGGSVARAEPWVLNESLDLPERLSITADQRTRYEYLDNQVRAGSPGSDQVLALRTRVRAYLDLTDWLSVGAEFQDSRAYIHDENTPLGTGMVNSAELLGAFLELTLDGPFGGSQTFQAGRFTMDIGSRRLVGRNRYRNTSNAFTGVAWRWHGEGEREFRAFYVLPIQRKPSDAEGIRDNEIEFDKTSSDFQFWGLFYADELPWGDRGELYLFGVRELDLYDPTDPEVTPNRKLFTGGFRLIRNPEQGHFDYEFETALQGGQSRKTEVDHFAHFHHLALGYTFALPGLPQLVLHYDYASGDSDPTDRRNEQFDTLFGARRFDFGPTSIYGAFARENINTPGLRLRLAPWPKWSAFIDYRAVWLAEARDEWVPNGVRDLSGNSGTFVGSQIEFRVRWNILPSNVLLELGYAHLFAGEFIDLAPNSNGGDTNYVYSQVGLNF